MNMTTTRTMKVAISGKTYYTALDESDILSELGIAKPTFAKRGFGVTAELEVTDDQALCLVEALEDIRDILGGSGVESEPSERAALKRDCARIRDALGR